MKKQAFTLIETLMAVTVISIVFMAVVGLILMTIQGNRRNLHKLQATAYAQEGLEAVRYLRDSNWLQNYEWTGIGAEASFGPGREGLMTVYLKYDPANCPQCWSFAEEDTWISDNGTEFSRRIEFKPIQDPADPAHIREESVEVTSIVEWQEGNVRPNISLSTYLTDWK